MFKKKSIDRQFVSKIDRALEEFNHSHPLSKAQQEEVDKYRRIYRLRDQKTAHTEEQADDQKSLWDF
jgi:hypothetical protein